LNKKYTIFVYSYFAFWFFYLIKYIIDIYYFNLLLIPANGKFYYLSQGIFITFINLLATFYAFKKISLSYFLNKLYLLFIIINILVTFFVIRENISNLQSLFTARYGLVADDDERVYLNPITIGISAATLLFLIIYKNNNKNFISLNLSSIFIISPIINLLISGSIGPFLAFCIALLFFFYKKYKYFLFILLMILFLSPFLFFLIDSEFSNNFILISRVLQGSEGSSVTTRNDLINLAINEFYSNPIIGMHYFNTKNYSSPHNLIVDIIMSTGLIGFILYVTPFLYILSRIFKYYLSSPIFPICLMHIILTQSSGYVFGANDYFIWMSVLLSIPQFIRMNKKL
jgi:O-antigen ligase